MRQLSRVACVCGVVCALHRSRPGPAPGLSLFHHSRTLTTDSFFASTALLKAPATPTAAAAAAQYQCGECAKTFRLLNALNHHIMTKHAGQAKALVMKEGKLEEVSVASAPSTTAAAQAPPAAAAAGTAAGRPTPASFPSLFPGAPMGGPTGAPAPSSGATAAAGATVEVRSQPTPSPSSSSPPAAEASTAAEAAAEEGAVADRRVFVCAVCQKTFRLEAALQHHYLAKHNMEMPTAAGAASSPSAAGHPDVGSSGSLAAAGAHAGDGGATVVEVGERSAAAASLLHYARQQEASLPQAPQYHLDVAPNAPEEGDVAAHWRCVNQCVLMGTVQDVQEGYVFEDHVLQFTVVTSFEGPSPGDPDKDFHTVRLYEEDYWRALRPKLREGGSCLVSGRLRMVPQYETALKKYFHFPVLQVYPGSGTVVIM